jgi:RNA polymerase sigma factor (sigma-70 family)
MGEAKTLTVPALGWLGENIQGEVVPRGWARPSAEVPARALSNREPSRQEAVLPGPGLDDAAWIARIQAGDEDAAQALVQRLYPTIIRSIRCHLPRRTSEADMAQVVFAKVFHKLDQFSGLVPLEHWVSRITINACLSQLKHETVRPEWCLGELSEEEQAVVQQLAASQDELPGESNQDARELLEKLLIQLKPEERLVITLLHLEEKSTKEISALTGWSLSRVKVTAFRTRLKMRKAWNKLVKGLEPGQETTIRHRDPALSF